MCAVRAKIPRIRGIPVPAHPPHRPSGYRGRGTRTSKWGSTWKWRGNWDPEPRRGRSCSKNPFLGLSLFDIHSITHKNQDVNVF